MELHYTDSTPRMARESGAKSVDFPPGEPYKENKRHIVVQAWQMSKATGPIKSRAEDRGAGKNKKMTANERLPLTTRENPREDLYQDRR